MRVQGKVKYIVALFSDLIDAISWDGAMRVARMSDLRECIARLTRAHSRRVRLYMIWMGCSASGVERDIHEASDDI